MNALLKGGLWALAFQAAFAHAGALYSMDDSELGEISGREGVIVGLEFYLNAQKSTNTALDGSAIGGTTLNLDGNCTGLNNNCRIAFQLAGREARNLNNAAIGGTGSFAAQGEWLVFKDSYMALKMPDLYLNGSTLGAARSAAAGYEPFLDVARFQNVSGTCLLSDGSASGTACTAANIKATPSLVMRHKQTTGYDNVSLSMKIGRLSVEYDTGACTYTGGTNCGYNKDAGGSYLGLSIRDNNTPFAGIAVGGSMYMFGF